MPVALSSETLVNVVTAGHQELAEVAVLDGGTAVASWLDAPPTGGQATAKLRLVAADGGPAGGEIALGAARDVSVAALKGGGFVAVWTTTSGATTTVQAQIFDAAGHAQGAAKALDAYTAQGPILSASAGDLEVIGLTDGGFALAWTSTRGDSGGILHVTANVLTANALGEVEGKTAVFSSSSKTGSDPHTLLTEVSGGKVLATWTGPFDPQAGTRQYAQTFDLQGAATGPAVQIGVRPFGQTGPGDFVGGADSAVASVPGGPVALVWRADGALWVSYIQPGDLAAGATGGRTPPQALATGLSGDADPDIARLPDGRLVVSWSSGGDVLARVVDLNGVPEGAAFPLGQVTSGWQRDAEVVALGDGRVLAVWGDQSGLGGDASGYGVKAQAIWLGQAQAGTVAGDALAGGDGGDAFAGLEGDDTLNGAGGPDTLSGGPGADVFVLTAGGPADRILDFARASGDRLDLRDAAGAPVQDGILILDKATGALSWDPDSDAGPLRPVALGTLNVTDFARGDFAAGVRPDGARILLADGRRQEAVFDWGDERFDWTSSTFDSQGRVQSYFVANDDGSTGQRWWDVEKTQAWTTRAAEYDAAAQLKAYAVTYDDGHTEVFQFDVTGSHAWTRMVDFYDAEGRQTVQAVAWDDGTAFERHHDTYDVHPWAYYIDNYRDGALLNHTFYNADGSVFVG